MIPALITLAHAIEVVAYMGLFFFIVGVVAHYQPGGRKRPAPVEPFRYEHRAMGRVPTHQGQRRLP
jgi:hypothetical protein